MTFDVAKYRRVAEQWESKGGVIDSGVAAVILLQLCDEVDHRQWIPVEERLPGDDRPVLVWNSGGDCPKPWAWWQICDYQDGKWREQDERDEYPGVTHWMPLPPEPLNWMPLPPGPMEAE